MDDELKAKVEEFRARCRTRTDLMRQDLEKWASRYHSADNVCLSDALLEACIDRKLDYLDEEDIKEFFLKALARQQEKRKIKMN
ncbi:hypothetical protein P0D88_41470 [Paraburkholderia sp. RL18-103-BIB-C]